MPIHHSNLNTFALDVTVKNQNKKNNLGFTLIELMIVIAIVGILASVAIPEYVKYTKRAKYSELILSTGKFKTTAEVAYNMGITLSEINSGESGVPPAITASTTHSEVLDSLTVTEGVIKATASSNYDSSVYQLEPTETAQGLTWSLNQSASTCLSLGYCSPP